MTILVDRERRASGVSCRAGRYFWHTIKLDDRVCASAPWGRYLRALGRLNHRRRAKFILEKKPELGGSQHGWLHYGTLRPRPTAKVTPPE